MNTATTSAPAPVAKKTAAPKKAAAAAVEAAAPAPVVAAASEKKAAPAVAPTTTPAVAEAPAAESAHASLNDEIKALQDQLTSIRDAANAALATLKRVSKRAATDIKEAGKKTKKRTETADGQPRKPSNFEIPVPISDELSAFLGGPKNNKMSRTNVTKAINQYLNEHKLREKHSITPNAALRKLLSIGEKDELTIFNIQTYLSKHYPKVDKAAVAPAK
jgi:chromatin remodeling complex protein RSC6